MRKERELMVKIAKKDKFIDKELKNLIERITPYAFQELGGGNSKIYQEDNVDELKQIVEFYLNEGKRISVEDRLGENYTHFEKTAENYLSLSIRIINMPGTVLYDLMSVDFANEYISGVITNHMGDDININIPTLAKLNEEQIHNLRELIGNQLYLWNIYNYGDYPNKRQPKIDKSIFLNSPAYKVSELKNGCVLLQVANDLDFEKFDQQYYDQYISIYKHIKNSI